MSKEEAPGQNKTYDIIVNGRPKTVTDHKLTYLAVVQLAYPGEQPADGIVFTVTFSNPHGKDGSMVEGDTQVIKDGIIFNVRKTDKS
ncbi:multiubiquitin domain-containing protein [Haliea sp. E1-2-M8]|uniref:multiubiquitin domain-containing protein n=1 Tax=Haliea sp. E1-2-M8 TaxID=3064706 RepID=UPI0027204FC8|nr:multiubiquitin domain-containing protein [Haliea sp. E1-2-M8]MDO8863243.1 multiubiquitin domain-containing protein [Haliea sp. E1-2-M8]